MCFCQCHSDGRLVCPTVLYVSVSVTVRLFATHAYPLRDKPFVREILFHRELEFEQAERSSPISRRHKLRKRGHLLTLVSAFVAHRTGPPPQRVASLPLRE